jgi:hypothetical protein
MQLTFLRHRLLQRVVALVMLTIFTLGSMVTATAQQSTPGITYKMCKPPPFVCLGKEAKEKWAKENNCRWPEDVCKSTPPDKDNLGAADADKGLWGNMWSEVKAGLVYGYEFVKGLMIGLKDQIADIYNMVKNIDGVVSGLIDLGKAFFKDPKGTLKQLAGLIGQEAVDTITRATQCGAYDLGHVIGSYVSPVFALKLASKLTKFSGDLAAASKAIKKDYGCASFGAGTLVYTPDGLVPIEQIQVGSIVGSRNESSFADKPQPVTNVFGRLAPSHRVLTTELDSIKVTDEHPLWVQGKGWIEASNVAVDDVLATARGDVLVRQNQAVAQPLRVYNFSVGSTPSYFVGSGAVWAHNVSCDIGFMSKKWDDLDVKKGERGFRGEYSIWEEWTQKGYKPVGESFDPKGKTPEDAYIGWAGQKGIDGIYEKGGNYYIIESKATKGDKPTEATCKESLCKTKNGDRQLSEAWLNNDRLDKLFPDPADRAKYDKAVADGKVKKIYAVTDEKGTRYFEVTDDINDPKEVNIGKKEWTPP